jgi:hypothetical protein
MMTIRRLALPCFFLLFVLNSAELISAQSGNSLPQIVQKDGRYALVVDGAPYLILGAQAHNSSGWPATLPKVWPVIEYLHANTLEVPVYWEQLEPEPGHFDFTVVDALLAQAREHQVHVVLLWFGTWKNGSSHYIPLWMKRAPERYPRMIGKNGRPVDSPSPFAAETLKADIQAFSGLMRHLKESDEQHTVLMVQVENEPGTWGSVRDYSPAAQKAFAAPVPAELLSALHKRSDSPNSNWQQVFGEDAEEFFHAWSVAHYIEQVAAAGKAIYPLPLYVNSALRNPFQTTHEHNYETGGPTDNVISIWKAAAPSIDLLAPDIYLEDSADYLKVLDLYHRPDNALFVPETGRSPAYSRYFFAALGHQAIGFAPFGMDYTRYANDPIGSSDLTEKSLDPFALSYKLVGPMQREIALLNFEGKLQAAVEQKGNSSESITFASWKVIVSYGLDHFGPGDHPPGNPQPMGRAFVAQLGPNEFLVSGFFCRVDFQPNDPSGKQREYVRVEEGTYDHGRFRPTRIWNGDQTDWGLNFASVPQVLRVAVGTF